MRICMVSGHACVRVQKMAIPLVEKGHKVYLIAKNIPSYYKYYSSILYTPHINHYLDAIELVEKHIDVFHAHNEPSWFVSAIKERTDKPVVLDVHDSFLTRVTQDEHEKLISDGVKTVRVTTEERNNFQLADAHVFPGDIFASAVRGEFALKQPFEVIPSALPHSWYQYNTGEWQGGLVYEGRVDLRKDTIKSPTAYGFRYCDYEDLAKQAHEIGIDFHIYSGNKKDDFMKVFGDIAYVHEGRR